MASVADQIPIAEGLFTWPSNDPRLLGSQCSNCGVVTFPAQSGCPACCGQDTETIELERQGKLWTWTVQAFLPNRPPYDGPETPETFQPFGVGYVEAGWRYTASVGHELTGDREGLLVVRRRADTPLRAEVKVGAEIAVTAAMDRWVTVVFGLTSQRGAIAHVFDLSPS